MLRIGARWARFKLHLWLKSSCDSERIPERGFEKILRKIPRHVLGKPSGLAFVQPKTQFGLRFSALPREGFPTSPNILTELSSRFSFCSLEGFLHFNRLHFEC